MRNKIDTMSLALGCLLGGLVVFTVVATTRKPPAWDYWARDGSAGALMPGTEMRLNQGYKVEQLIATSQGPDKDPYVIVILKREKTAK